MAAWRAYIETFGDLSAALEKDLVEQGLTLGDYQVLVYLSEADDGSMRMCDLADVLQLSPSGLTPPTRRPRQERPRHPSAVRARRQSDDGDAHQRRARPPGIDCAASRRQRSSTRLRPSRRRHKSTRWRRSSLRSLPASQPSRPATATLPDDRHDMTDLPRGFTHHVANIGIKDDTDDFVVVTADRPRPLRRAVHQEPVRRTERAPESRARRGRHGPGSRGHLQELERRHRRPWHGRRT